MRQDLSDPDDTLQAQGDVLLARLAARESVQAEAEALIGRLRDREWEGDDVLAEELEASLSAVSVLGKRLRVDLDDLANELEGDPMQEAGVVDLQTGDVVPGFMSDPAMVGEDDAVDTEEEPERWLFLPPKESREAWRDMALFAERAAPPLRDRLEHALEGKRAFRRFRDQLAQADQLRAFQAFADDRARGRARQFLADQGIRATPH